MRARLFCRRARAVDGAASGCPYGLDGVIIPNELTEGDVVSTKPFPSTPPFHLNIWSACTGENGCGI
jgi:hypothetical protein